MQNVKVLKALDRMDLGHTDLNCEGMSRELDMAYNAGFAAGHTKALNEVAETNQPTHTIEVNVGPWFAMALLGVLILTLFKKN